MSIGHGAVEARQRSTADEAVAEPTVQQVQQIAREAQALAATGAQPVQAAPLLWGLAGRSGPVALRMARASLLDELRVAENQALFRHATHLVDAALRG